MPISPDFVSRVTEQLQAARPVQIKKMFGGLGIYLDDAFFGVADDDRLYFKVGPATVALYEERGMGPWVMPQGPNNKYREVPADVLSDRETLGDWIDAAAAVAHTAKKK
jgi:DNA transformation protein